MKLKTQIKTETKICKMMKQHPNMLDMMKTKLQEMTLCGSRMPFQDIHFFYGWLSNRNSQLKINFIGLVYMVPIDAHSVSATMRITTTCSLNAPILKRSGGMFVTDVTFQE
jgi:hypothetical protein